MTLEVLPLLFNKFFKTIGGSKLLFISLSMFLIILNKKGMLSIINLLKIEYIISSLLSFTKLVILNKFPKVNFSIIWNIIFKLSDVVFDIILSVTMPLYIGFSKIGKINPPINILIFSI